MRSAAWVSPIVSDACRRGVASATRRSHLQPHVPRLKSIVPGLQPYAPRLQPYAPRLQPYAPRLHALVGVEEASDAQHEG